MNRKAGGFHVDHNNARQKMNLPRHAELPSLPKAVGRGLKVNNLKIGFRLGLGFGTIIALLIGIVTVSLSHIGAAERRTESILKDRYLKVALVTEVKYNVATIRQHMYRALTARNREDIARELEAINGIRARNTVLLRQFDELINLQQSRVLFTDIVAAREKDLRAQAELFALIDAGKLQEARGFIDGELDRIQAAYVGKLTNMAELQEDKMEEESTLGKAEFGRARTMLLILGIAAIACACAVALLAIRNITHPMHEAVDTARRVAKADGTASIEVRSQDETGQIMQALQDMNERLRQTRERLRDLVAHQDRAKEEERKRIAREIHDELGGLLTGIKSYLSFAVDCAEQADKLPDRHLLEACALADSAIETAHRVITDLRPSVLDQLGLWAALEWYAGEIEERTGLRCRTTIDESAASMDIGPECSTTVFRIVQETLTNVVRHADASNVDIRIACENGAMVITMEDDGKGIASERLLNAESWGIAGMHERARYMGGELKIAGTPGQGTVVALRLPLENRNGR
jgi:signal transduction histidine kinase